MNKIRGLNWTTMCFVTASTTSINTTIVFPKRKQDKSYNSIMILFKGCMMKYRNMRERETTKDWTLFTVPSTSLDRLTESFSLRNSTMGKMILLSSMKDFLSQCLKCLKSKKKYPTAILISLPSIHFFLLFITTKTQNHRWISISFHILWLEFQRTLKKAPKIPSTQGSISPVLTIPPWKEITSAATSTLFAKE